MLSAKSSGAEMTRPLFSMSAGVGGSFLAVQLLILSETLKKFHSHDLPLFVEKAWPQTGRSLFRASQRKTTRIGFPFSVSLPKKWPTPFWSKEPTTGGSILPVLLAIQ